MRQCSGATGVELAILRRAKAKGCPGFSSAGRVDFTQVKPWLDLHTEELQAEVEENSRDHWSLELLKTQTKRQQFAYESEQGKYLAKEVVAQQVAAIAASAKAVLKSRLEDELPAKLAGLDAIAVKELLTKTPDDVCAVFQGGFDSWK
jgi:hypothetical protein